MVGDIGLRRPGLQLGLWAIEEESKKKCVVQKSVRIVPMTGLMVGDNKLISPICLKLY